MSRQKKLKIVTQYELLKQFRRRRFIGALIIVIFAQILMIGFYHGLNIPEALSNPSIGIIIQDTPELFAMFITSMSAIAILAAVFFSGDAIASEFEHGTGYMLFPNPVRRTTLVIGKYLACFIATAVILGLAYLISAGALVGFYGEVPFGILGSLAIALMMACCVISIAFAFSSALKGGMGATIATLLIFMVISPIISSSLAYAGYNPWFMPDRAGDAVGATYGVPFEELVGGFYGGGQMMGGMLQASQDPIRSFFVLTAYAVVLFLISIWMTERREFV